MSFLITAIIELFDSIFPIFHHQAATNQATTNTIQNSSIRNNRRPRRRNNRYQRYRIDLNNNFRRAHIILRARQITARNRELASLAEQSLIDAILQAREEEEIRQAAVQSLRTRNERPPRPLPGHTVDIPAV
jgi:hypothetical protein